jgi:hypothetical protein
VSGRLERAFPDTMNIETAAPFVFTVVMLSKLARTTLQTQANAFISLSKCVSWAAQTWAHRRSAMISISVTGL